MTTNQTPIERAAQAIRDSWIDRTAVQPTDLRDARAAFASIDTGELARALREHGWEDIEAPFEDLYGIDFDGIAQAVKNHLTGESE